MTIMNICTNGHSTRYPLMSRLPLNTKLNGAWRCPECRAGLQEAVDLRVTQQ